MPPKRKPLGDLALIQSSVKRTKTSTTPLYGLGRMPDTPLPEPNIHLPRPELASQGNVPSTPALSISINPKTGYNNPPGRKKKRISALNLPGILNYHPVEVPFTGHKAQVITTLLK